MKTISFALFAVLFLAILAGCTPVNLRPASTPIVSGNQTSGIASGGLIREYVVHVPPQYDGRTILPVVIMFHGGVGNVVHALSETGWDVKADQEGFLAVFPQGTRPDASKLPAFIGTPPGMMVPAMH